MCLSPLFIDFFGFNYVDYVWNDGIGEGTKYGGK